MKRAPRRSATPTTLSRFRRSRTLASTTLLTTLLSTFGPLIPRTASAQSAVPANPGNAGVPLGTGNAALQEGQTDLGIPETGASAALQTNWSVDPSTGAFTASIPFTLPTARGAVQPSLALSYSSSTGHNVGGIGWSLNLPAIERHDPSGLPQYNDPDAGTPITTTGPAQEDWFTFGGKALVPICLVDGGGSCAPLTTPDGTLAATETMPSWASGWHYYRLEVETGANLRFFWSNGHQTWVVQDPSGATMEFGVPQDDASDVGGIDTAAASTSSIYRWNLTCQYDAQRSGGQPTNQIKYSWAKLPFQGLSGGGTVPTPVLISDLTDIYDTPPLGTTLPIPTTAFAHHVHLNYDTHLDVFNSTRVERGTHNNYLMNVDVTSYPYGPVASTSTREQIRRYLFSYKPAGPEFALWSVNVDGWCASGAPHEKNEVLSPEVNGTPACGIGPTGSDWPPVTTFTYSNSPAASASASPTYVKLLPLFTSRPFWSLDTTAIRRNAPSIMDVNSDGLPDLIDGPASTGGTQTVWLNSLRDFKISNQWMASALTLNNPGPLNATASAMQAFNPGYTSAAVANDGAVNALLFNAQWASGALSKATTAGVMGSLYAPTQLTSSIDWGVPTQYNIPSVYPGCINNCWPEAAGAHNPAGVACQQGTVYLGCDMPFANIDIDGDGLQDLIVSSEYGTCNSPKDICEASQPGTYLTPHFSTGFNAKFTQRSQGGVVTPFAAPLPQEVGDGSNNLNVGGYPADAPNVCVAKAQSGASPFLDGNSSTFADINGDGIPDIVELYSDHLLVWYGHGDGVFGVCADGTTECSCDQSTGSVSFSTTTSGGWETAWSPLGIDADLNLNAQFHDVDGDGFDDAIVPSADGFDVYFITTRTGAVASLHVNAAAGFGWQTVNVGGAMWQEPPVPPNDSMYLFADMDGSGVDDVLIENSSGQMGYVNVLGGPRPGLLTGIQVSSGLQTSITYDDLAALSRETANSSSPWATTSPQSIHVVTDVVVTDQSPGVSASAVPVETKYVYTSPIYDGRDRQFVGFASAEVINIGDASEPTMHTKTTFYQGYCNDATTLYPCPTTPDYPNHALRGLPILTETYGDQGPDNSQDGPPGGGPAIDGAALGTTHRTFGETQLYKGLDGRYVHRVSNVSTDTYLFDNTAAVARNHLTQQVDVTSASGATLQPELPYYLGASPSHLVSTRKDLDVWGMAGANVDLGDVSATGTSATGAIVQGNQASVLSQDSVDHWIWRTSEAVTFGTLPSSTVQYGTRTVDYFYDSRGNLLYVTSPLTGEQPMVRSGTTMPEAPDGGAGVAPGAPLGASINTTVTIAKYTPDPSGSGNVMRIEQGTSRCQDVVYDLAYSLLPVATTTHVTGCGDVGLSTAAMDFAYGLGLAKSTTSPDGQVTQVQYDALGRMRASSLPDATIPGFGLTTVTVDYGDTLSPRQVHTTLSNGVSSIDHWTVLDGYGRTIMNAAPGDTSAGDLQPYILSGQVRRNARGQITTVFPPTFANGWSSGSAGGTGPARTLQYDAFGRVVSATDLNGTMALRRTYGSQVYNEQGARQIPSGAIGASILTAPAGVLGTTVFADGHGRPALAFSTGNGGLLETQLGYLPTGEVWFLSRIGADGTGNTYPPYQRWMYYDSLGRMVVNAEPATMGNAFYPQVLTKGPQQPSPSIKAWTYAYDDAGDLVATTDARGCGRNIGYDGAGRPTYEDYIGCTADHAPYTPPNPTTGAGTEIFYRYDALGRLGEVYDRAAHTAYGYDSRSRVTSVTRNIAQPNVTPVPGSTTGYAPTAFEQQFAYDDFDRLIGQTTGEDEATPDLLGTPVTFGTATSPSAVTLSYSQRGVVQAVGGSYGSLIQQATYVADGRPAKTVWGDLASTETDYTYDTFGFRLHERKTSRSTQSLWTGAAGGSWYTPPPADQTTPTLVDDDIFAYDAIGNVTGIHDGRADSTATTNEWPAVAQPVHRVMGYDDFNRIKEVDYDYPTATTYASPSAAATQTESPFPLSVETQRIGFEKSVYDPFGNRTTSSSDPNTFFDSALGPATTGSVGGFSTNQPDGRYPIDSGATRCTVRRSG